MLMNSLFSGGIRGLLITLLLTLPAVILCLSIHETCHGLAAYALGDRTAANQGRLTLDPMAHIDPMGFLCMLLLGFGWAKPVPVNTSNFKNRRAGMAIVAAAGPVSNFLIGCVGYLLYFHQLRNRFHERRCGPVRVGYRAVLPLSGNSFYWPGDV